MSQCILRGGKEIQYFRTRTKSFSKWSSFGMIAPFSGWIASKLLEKLFHIPAVGCHCMICMAEMIKTPLIDWMIEIQQRWKGSKDTVVYELWLVFCLFCRNRMVVWIGTDSKNLDFGRSLFKIDSFGSRFLDWFPPLFFPNPRTLQGSAISF